MKTNSYYSQKLVFITGGSSGIGRSLALQCAAMGANIVLAARRVEQLQITQAEVEAARLSASQKIITLPLNIADGDEVAENLAVFTREHGTPDILINSAGITLPGHFEDLPLETFHDQMDVNYFGTVHVIKAFIHPMIQRRFGHIINISSAAGFIGTYGYSAYSASKFAVRGFSDTLRAEMRRHHIRVSVVMPSDVDTPQLTGETPHKPAVTRILSATSKVVSPDFVARVTLREAARNRYIITPGSDVSFLFFLANFLGRLTYPVMDWMIKDAQRQINKGK